MKNVLFALVGFVMLAIGAAGLVIPLLPTTPFVIIAVACFTPHPTIRSRVMKIPFVNEYVLNHKERKGISSKTVTLSLTFLWVMLAISAMNVKKAWIILCLALVGIAVTVHIIVVSKPRKNGSERITRKLKNEQEGRQ